MTSLPSCPAGCGEDTLETQRTEMGGVIVATCAVCRLTVRIAPTGHILHAPWVDDDAV